MNTTRLKHQIRPDDVHKLHQMRFEKEIETCRLYLEEYKGHVVSHIWIKPDVFDRTKWTAEVALDTWYVVIIHGQKTNVLSVTDRPFR